MVHVSQRLILRWPCWSRPWAPCRWAFLPPSPCLAQDFGEGQGAALSPSSVPIVGQDRLGLPHVSSGSRPCVDCHAFEFMQRALQDLKKTAYSLDSRTETLLFKVEKRTLCDCLTANTLN
uniref:NELL2-interacting cell ontogeny regulator 1 n=1 Tax=Varanus komodoensis TaxID=61221 RepID=A0A8D2JA46_VARKO